MGRDQGRVFKSAGAGQTALVPPLRLRTAHRRAETLEGLRVCAGRLRLLRVAKRDLCKETLQAFPRGRKCPETGDDLILGQPLTLCCGSPPAGRTYRNKETMGRRAKDGRGLERL